ncbi:hypothetical protein STEG23_036589, partial [Scotinomys teguina]
DRRWCWILSNWMVVSCHVVPEMEPRTPARSRALEHLSHLFSPENHAFWRDAVT